MIRSLGAEPVELPYGQVLTGLATRLLDGAENNWAILRDHGPLQACRLLHPHRAHDEPRKGSVISLKAWQSLSDRRISRSSARAALRSSRFMREKWRDLEEQSQKKAEAAGVAVVREIDRKPFEDAMAPIYAKAGRDAAAAALIERIRKVK